MLGLNQVLLAFSGRSAVCVIELEQRQRTSWRDRLRAMWDVLSWHNGTLSIAWWAVLVLVVFLLGMAGHGGQHWHKH